MKVKHADIGYEHCCTAFLKHFNPATVYTSPQEWNLCILKMLKHTKLITRHCRYGKWAFSPQIMSHAAGVQLSSLYETCSFLSPRVFGELCFHSHTLTHTSTLLYQQTPSSSRDRGFPAHSPLNNVYQYNNIIVML